MSETKKCPDCGGSMELGFIPDAYQSVYAQSHWHRGAPEKWKFLGLPVATKVSTTKWLPIVAYRCTSCSLVRTYAPPQRPNA